MADRLFSGSVDALYAPKRSTETGTASSAGVSGALNLGDLLQLEGRYSRGDTEENQNREHKYRGYEGTATVKTSEVLNGIAPDWMTLDDVSVTYGKQHNRSTDPEGGVRKSGTRARGVGAGLSIGDLGLVAEYMERGLYDDPNRQFSASATHPVGDGRVSGEFRRNINPDPRQEDETYVGGNVTIPFQEGGIASLPKNPVLGGQEHMLAYITPEEASTLRAQGGGVTPDGGQYTGPGGIASFVVGGTGPGVSGPPSGQGQASTPGNVGTASTSSGTGSTSSVTGYGPYGNVHGTVPGTKGFVSVFSPSHATPAAIRSLLTKDMESRINPDSFAKAMQDPKGFLSDSFTGSMFGKVRSALDNGLVDITTHGLMDSTFGHVTALTPAQAAQEAMGLAVPAQDRINVGDAHSAFGKAVLGLATPVMSLLAPPLALPLTAMEMAYNAAHDDSTLGFDFSGMANKAAEAIGLGETPVGDVSEAVTGSTTPLGDVFSYAGDQLGNIFGPPTPSTATTPDVPGGPGLVPTPDPMQLEPLSVAPPIPTVTETLEDFQAPPDVNAAAQQLADATGATLDQALAYFDSRYA